MSISKAENPVSNGNLDATFTQSAKRKPRVYPSRARLPNKTQWALADMLRHAKSGRVGMDDIRKWIERERLDAKGRYDVQRLDRLGELSQIVLEATLHVAELERLASDARLGEYNEQGNQGDAKPPDWGSP